MVVHAETTDHFNWQLIGEVAKKMTGAEGKALKEAYEEVEDEEDEHYYHSKGWLRELSLAGPRPEGGAAAARREEKHVKSAIGQARAEQRASRASARVKGAKGLTPFATSAPLRRRACTSP